ncbi:ABC transporter substrate-binding protein [Clostridium butyricum]
MKKIICSMIVSILILTSFTGCKSSDKSNVVNISILNSKPEITVALHEAAKDFMEENEDINIKLVKYSQSSSYIEKVNFMYEAGNAPTMIIMDSAHIRSFKDKFVDLSTEEWIKDISGDIPDIAKNDSGNIIGFPFTTEGMGFIYNKKVTDEAGIDVKGINSTSALEEAFNKINAIGKNAIIVTNEEWSLGDHFLSTFYSIDSEKSGINTEMYFENLKKSPEAIKNNGILNGLIDTFDLMKKYNMYADNPMSPSYDKCAELLGKGDVGFWYMGNWASMNILANSNGNNEFGFISVPVSNDSSAYGQNEIVVDVTKYIVIDSNNSLEQQEAAKRFLNYLVYNEKGNEFIVEDCGIIPSFNNINISQTDPLVSDIIKNRNDNKTMDFMTSYLPSNNSAIVGNLLRRYLNNEITRENLLDEICNFWANI